MKNKFRNTKLRVRNIYKKIIYHLRRTKCIHKLELVSDNSGINIFKIFDFSLNCHDIPISSNFNIRVFDADVDIKDVNWHKDYKSGYVYPYKRFDKIKYNLLYNKGVDVIFTWELSRFYFGTTLALLYQKTRDLSYYNTFKSLVYDWLDKNKYLYGITWTCAMDVAIRAANWVMACNIFSDIFFNDHDFLRTISDNLIKHAHYVETLEWTSPRNNHLISDYCSLLILALSLRNYRKSEQWLQKSLKGIEECMDKQIFSDGVDFENAIPYHRLVLETLSIATIIAHNQNIRFSENYYVKLFGMFEFAAAYMDQSGNAPQIGDNDSGRFIVWQQQPENDHRYLLLLGESIFEYGFLRNFKKNDLFSIFPIKFRIDIQDLNIIPRITSSSISFLVGGYYILKNERYHLVVFCPNTVTGGHRHYDSGSFTLSYKGKQIIVDSGVHSYTRELNLRRELRDYKSHNIYVEDNYINPNNNTYFGVKIDRLVKVTFFSDQELIIESILPSSVKIIRHFKLQDNSILIEDKIEGTIQTSSYFHFPTKNIIQIKTNEYIYDDCLKISINDLYKSTSKIEENYYSPSYDVLHPSSCLTIRPQSKLNILITGFNEE